MSQAERAVNSDDEALGDRRWDDRQDLGYSSHMSSVILCGVDEGDAASERPLRIAADLAERLGERLVVATVTSVSAFVPGLPSMGVPAGGLAQGMPPAVAVEEEAGSPEEGAARERERERVRTLAQRAGVPDDAEVVVHPAFSPQEGLHELARIRGASMLVVGSHGHGAVHAALLGSTSHALAAHPPCPVLIVPPPAEDDGG